MRERDRDRLRHIRDAGRRAIEITDATDRTSLRPESTEALALARLLEIIGEATNQVSDGLRRRHPDLPWQQASDMRNVLAHAYFRVNRDILWRTVVEDLPPFLAAVERILAEEG